MKPNNKDLEIFGNVYNKYLKKFSEFDDDRKVCNYIQITKFNKRNKKNYNSLQNNYKNVDFYVDYYKNILEIIDGEGSYERKLKEWFFMERFYNGLVDFKITLNPDIETNSENVCKSILGLLEYDYLGKTKLVVELLKS